MAVTKVERWVTSDDRQHHTLELAEAWEDKIIAADRATEMLLTGASVADCLKFLDYVPDIPPILEQVTHDTQLVISHWQCRNTPGYMVVSFKPNCRVHVWGDAGSWSGPYGNEVTIADLARYAEERNTKL